MEDKLVAGRAKPVPDLGMPTYGSPVMIAGHTFYVGTIDRDGQGNLQVTLYKEGQLPSKDEIERTRPKLSFHDV